MIIEFSVRNYKSIADKQTFSMIAQNGDEFEENVTQVTENKKLRLVNSSAIYGPNAAGKSNIISALKTMAQIVVNSAVSKTTSSLPVVSFKLDQQFSKSASEFELNFISEGIRYQYGFTLSEEQIIDEWLFAFPKGRAQKWFVRLWDEEKQDYEWELGNSLVGEKSIWTKSTRKNALFLSTAIQLNSSQLKPVYDWFNTRLRVSHLLGFDQEFSAERCINDKKEILNFLKAADVGIDDLVVKKEKFDPKSIPDEMPEPLKNLVIEKMKDSDEYIIQTMHKNSNGDMTLFDLEDESHGTRKLFGFAGPILDSLKCGNVLVIDELNNNLHPKIVEFIVKLFHNKNINNKGAQLIFSTHETSILNQKIFRRDQIWFVEKDSSQATSLFPLSDFSPRKGREDLESAYLEGRYGALPFVDASKEF
ncbi:AAA family ATPase [Rosenbergiella australiborealis]|uniref:AAA family ATPase n=1 Tax=Rosenbergiella australiborealis TaxID=1544696 RepID=UPI001F4D9229|nr:ATP-binding protein [Rosenbergiella australiborealis]